MLPREPGTMIFTGATASLRGREGLAAFAGAKHGPRVPLSALRPRRHEYARMTRDRVSG